MPAYKPGQPSIICPVCGGDGKCSECGGLGYHITGTYDVPEQEQCMACFHASEGGNCSECDGTGRVPLPRPHIEDDDGSEELGELAQRFLNMHGLDGRDVVVMQTDLDQQRASDEPRLGAWHPRSMQGGRRPVLFQADVKQGPYPR